MHPANASKAPRTVTDKFVMTYKAGEPKPEAAVAANENRSAK